MRAVDAVRNQLASGAQRVGFAEFMWIDADIVFDPDDVEKLRAYNLPSSTCPPRDLHAQFSACSD